MKKIIVIDDARAIQSILKDILTLNSYIVDTADSAEDGLELIRNNKYDLIISDVSLTGMNGVQLLKIVKSEQPQVPFLIISGHANVSMTVDVIKVGAFNVLEKPLDLNIFLQEVRCALEATTNIDDDKITKATNSTTTKGESPMVGESQRMLVVKDMIGRASISNAKVLILGENGTGKEVVAHEIHRLSHRHDKAFIEINCAAIPSELIESELFGHEKGSFTGAHKLKKGQFELADKGTIFLDEIGDMSVAAQAKVLRVLQENKITRVGGDKDIRIDVRVIAATNKDLVQEIKQGRFREDLYHRLSIVIIRVPKLNDRIEDIPRLANHFLEILCPQYDANLKTINDDAMAMLQSHNWSGNVRELHNIVERLIVFCGDVIDVNDIKKYVNEEYGVHNEIDI